MRRFLGLCWLIIFSFTILTTSVSAQQDVVHVVQKGETLYRISVRYGVSMWDVARANGLYNLNLIYTGQRLVIPNATTPPPPPPPNPTPQPQPSTYTVIRGDTLNIIARKFNTTYQAIANLNGITNPNRIYVGQVLKIPAAGTNPPPQPNPNPNPNPSPITTTFELGGHVISDDFRYSNLMRDTGMVWAKKQIRFNQGDSPEVARTIIDGAKQRGFKILLGVAGNPSQLRTNPTQYYQDYATFVGGLAALGADAIEVWNEPNIDREWPAGLVSGGNYTQMLIAAYQAIKNRNSNTLVISGAPAPTGGLGCNANGCNDDAFIAQMKAAGATNFMDCVGIHYNAGAVSPLVSTGAPVGSATHYSWYYPSMVNLYSSVFPTKPLCFTEIGYLSSEGFGPLPANFAWAAGTSVAEQAEWLASAVRQARNARNVRLFIVWNVDATNYGDDPQAGYAIVRPDGTCPACNTMRQALQ